MTLQELRAALFELTKEPISGSKISADHAINAALLWAQRSHNFMLAEDEVDLTYTADAKSEDLPTPTPAGSSIKELIAVEDPDGKQLDKLSKAQFLEWRNRFGTSATRAPSFYTFGDQLAIFPAPGSDTTYTLHINKLFKPLSGFGDSNFLTENGWDFVIYHALSAMIAALPGRDPSPALAREIELRWLSLLEWDYRLRGDYHEAQKLAQRKAQIPMREKHDVYREDS